MLGNSSFNLGCPLCLSSLYICGFMSEREKEKGRERIWRICKCVYRAAAASMCTQNLLHNLPAYFKALMQYCFSFFCCCLLPLAPIFCLIVIHVQSVCLANLLVFRPSRQSYACPCVTECILCYLL